MDWSTLGITFIGGLAGGAIALIGNYMAIKNQNKILKTQLAEQKTLFEKQISYKENIENETLINRKKEAATILYYLIPEIAWEGFQIHKKSIKYPSTILSNYDYNNALNVLRDELEKSEVLYMVKLFANIEAIKTAKPNSEEFLNSYYQFLCGFSNGYVNCGPPYYTNTSNNKRGNKMPFDLINDVSAKKGCFPSAHLWVKIFSMFGNRFSLAD
jgi:hypothetical protein